MNYGNTLMAKGDLNGALDYFHRALALAPQYSVLLINLAIAEDCDEAGRSSRATFQGRVATRAGKSRQLHLLCALLALALARRGGTRVPAQCAGA